MYGTVHTDTGSLVLLLYHIQTPIESLMLDAMTCRWIGNTKLTLSLLNAWRMYSVGYYCLLVLVENC